MHFASIDKIDAFCTAYLRPYREAPLAILDVGSAVIGGGRSPYRAILERTPWSYTGMDVADGPNVDLIVGDPYDWRELRDASFDVVVSGQAFEHIEFPWLTISEISRVLRPNGLAAIVAPSRGNIHRYPVDCWRFYPDGFPALAKYTGLRVIEAHLQQSYAYPGVQWGDAVLIAQRPERTAEEDRSWTMRNRALKLSLPGSDPAAMEDASRGLGHDAVASIISPAEELAAIRARECQRLSELPIISTRFGIARSHLTRAVKAVLRRPFDRLTHL